MFNQLLKGDSSTTHDTSPNATDQAANQAAAWHTEDEFRVGTVCVRLEYSYILEQARATFATTPEGLDSPEAFTIDRLWDLHRALSAIGVMLEIVDSATMCEERIVNRELTRLNVRDLDADPEDAIDASKHSEWNEPTRKGGENTAFAEGFSVSGLAGRVVVQPYALGEYTVYLANHRWDLATPSRCIMSSSVQQLRMATEVASTMVEIARGDDGVKALGYRCLTQLGASTFPSQPSTRESA